MMKVKIDNTWYFLMSELERVSLLSATQGLQFQVTQLDMIIERYKLRNSILEEELRIFKDKRKFSFDENDRLVGIDED